MEVWAGAARRFENEERERLVDCMTTDAEFLEKIGVMDYSLLTSLSDPAGSCALSSSYMFISLHQIFLEYTRLLDSDRLSIL